MSKEQRCAVTGSRSASSTTRSARSTTTGRACASSGTSSTRLGRGPAVGRRLTLGPSRPQRAGSASTTSPKPPLPKPRNRPVVSPTPPRCGRTASARRHPARVHPRAPLQRSGRAAHDVVVERGRGVDRRHERMQRVEHHTVRDLGAPRSRRRRSWARCGHAEARNHERALPAERADEVGARLQHHPTCRPRSRPPAWGQRPGTHEPVDAFFTVPATPPAYSGATITTTSAAAAQRPPVRDHRVRIVGTIDVHRRQRRKPVEVVHVRSPRAQRSDHHVERAVRGATLPAPANRKHAYHDRCEPSAQRRRHPRRDVLAQPRRGTVLRRT